MKAILREETGAYLREFALLAEDYDSAVEEVTQMMDNGQILPWEEVTAILE